MPSVCVSISPDHTSKASYVYRTIALHQHLKICRCVPCNTDDISCRSKSKEALLVSREQGWCLQRYTNVLLTTGRKRDGVITSKIRSFSIIFDSERSFVVQLTKNFRTKDEKFSDKVNLVVSMLMDYIATL